jgi:hypothetical protein
MNYEEESSGIIASGEKSDTCCTYVIYKTEALS